MSDLKLEAVSWRKTQMVFLLQPRKLNVSQTVTLRFYFSEWLKISSHSTFHWGKVPPGKTPAPWTAPSLPCRWMSVNYVNERYCIRLQKRNGRIATVPAHQTSHLLQTLSFGIVCQQIKSETTFFPPQEFITCLISSPDPVQPHTILLDL